MPLRINNLPNFTPYKRLKNVFHKNLNYSLDFYEKLEETQNPVIGNLPDDILQFIINKFPENKKSRIQEVKDVFAKASRFFRKDGQKLEQEIDEMIKSNYVEGLLDKVFFLGYSMSEKDSAQKLAFCKKAGPIIKKMLEDVFPKDMTINVEWLNQGAYSDVFRMQFLKSTKEKIFSDKVLKIHKSMPESTIKIYKYLMKDGGKAVYDYFYSTCPTKNSADYYAQVMTNDFIVDALYYLGQAKSHSLEAEANGFYYMKRNNGHRIKGSNFLNFDMYDVKNKYSLSEFVENSSENLFRKKINLEKIGIIHTDLHPRNIVSGVCVDMGGIELQENILTDKYIRKILNKIINEKDSQKRESVINSLIVDSQDIKIPNRKKIQQALDIYFLKYRK